MRRSTLLLIGLLTAVGLTLLASSGGCSGAEDGRESMWRAYRESADALSQRLWGQALEEAAAIEARTSFDCVWERLEAAGTDPRPDLRCTMEQRAALGACLDTGGELAACQARGEATCALSAPFREASRVCAPPRPPRP